MTDRSDTLGTPTLEVAGLRLWVHGRAEPEAEDYEYGNWLNLTVHCAACGASVWAQGAILMAPDFAAWADECEALRDEQAVEAELSSYEPNLRVTIRSSGEDGRLKMRVEITPDHLHQAHRFEYRIDYGELQTILSCCRSVVETYPVRGLREQRDPD